MPNHVSHKITFAAEHAETIFAAVCPGGHFDFATLIPVPLQMYRGDLSSEDDADFACNWNSWSRDNWGTKWNAYDCTASVSGDVACISFDTAWSVPYPVLSAFCNRFQVPFEHKYYDECANFWGVETWGFRDWPKRAPKLMQRISKRRSEPEDRAALCVELKGYNP